MTSRDYEALETLKKRQAERRVVERDVTLTSKCAPRSRRQCQYSSVKRNMSFVPIVNARVNVYSERPRKHLTSASLNQLDIERQCHSLSTSKKLATSPVSTLLSSLFKRKPKAWERDSTEELKPPSVLAGVQRSKSIDIPRPILKISAYSGSQQSAYDSDESAEGNEAASPQSEGRSPRLRSVSINEVVEVLRMEDNTTFQMPLAAQPDPPLLVPR